MRYAVGHSQCWRDRGSSIRDLSFGMTSLVPQLSAKSQTAPPRHGELGKSMFTISLTLITRCAHGAWGITQFDSLKLWPAEESRSSSIQIALYRTIFSSIGEDMSCG